LFGLTLVVPSHEWGDRIVDRGREQAIREAPVKPLGAFERGGPIAKRSQKAHTKSFAFFAEFAIGEPLCV
jgi:hypothetical protein